MKVKQLGAPEIPPLSIEGMILRFQSTIFTVVDCNMSFISKYKTRYLSHKIKAKKGLNVGKLSFKNIISVIFM